MHTSVADPNLLFLVLARQLSFISRGDLEESVGLWRDDAVRSPGRRLVQQRVLQRDEYELLTTLKQRLLRKYHHDPGRCLALIASAGSSIVDELRALDIATDEGAVASPTPLGPLPQPSAAYSSDHGPPYDVARYRSTRRPSDATTRPSGTDGGIDYSARTATLPTHTWHQPERAANRAALQTEDAITRVLISRGSSSRYHYDNAIRSGRGARMLMVSLVLLLVAISSVITYALTAAKKDQELATANGRADEANTQLQDVASQAEASQEEHDAVLQFVRQNVLSASRPFFWDGGLGRDTTVNEAIDVAEQQIAESCADRPLVEASLRSLWGDTFVSLGELELASEQHEQVCELREAKLGADHPSTLAARDRLGMTYLAHRDSRRGLPILEDTLKRRSNTLGPSHLDTIRSMNHLAMANVNRKRLSKAMELYEDTLRLSVQSLGPNHRETLSTMFQAATARLRTEEPQEALPMFADLVARSRDAHKGRDQEFATLLSNVAQVLSQYKQYAASESYWRECVSIREASAAKKWELFDAQARLGIALAVQGSELLATDPDAARQKFAEAEPLLKSGSSGLLHRAVLIPVPQRKSVVVALDGLVYLYNAWGKPEEAAKWQQLLIQARARNLASRII